MTEIQVEFIRLLHGLKVRNEYIEFIVNILDDIYQIKQLALYIQANPTATEDEIAEMAVKIYQESQMEQTKENGEKSK